MSELQVSCFHCQQDFRVTGEQLGGQVTCPHCQGLVRLPEADTIQEVEEQPVVFGSWLTRSTSLIGSCVFHTALLILAAFIVLNYSGGGGEGEEVIIGEMPSESLQEGEDDKLDPNESKADAKSEQLDDVLEIETPQTDAPAQESMDVNLAQFTPSGASGGGSSDIGTLGGGGGASLGEGASFMGLRAKGTRFCIIADCSGSMSGKKLEHVKQEIIETLSSMRGRGRFQLVFFQTRALPFPHTGWRHPKKDRPKAVAWLAQIGAGGGTNPLPAFDIAFKLSPKPDAIFFMTDGLFNRAVVPRVKALNAGNKKVKINTISFISKSSEQLMRTIAKDSGGKYRHVSAF